MIHADLNPFAYVAFGLCAVIVAYWLIEPYLIRRRRRARLLAARHARVAEDQAWANREPHAELAGRLRWARIDEIRSTLDGGS